MMRIAHEGERAQALCNSVTAEHSHHAAPESVDVLLCVLHLTPLRQPFPLMVSADRKTLSGPSEEMLDLQGIGWMKRKAAGLGSQVSRIQGR